MLIISTFGRWLPMYMSIRTKLFILIVLANALMLVVLLSVNAASFSRSFSDYVAQQESRRLQLLVNNISTEFQQTNTWQWLRWDNPRWNQILGQSLSPRELRAFERTPPQAAGSMRNFLERLVVRDNSGRTLIGRKRNPNKLIWLPITDANGQMVAELGFEPNSRIDSQFDDVFAKQQTRNIAITSLLGFLIAAALAIPFSGLLVRPIKKLTTAVRQMTHGDLSVQVDENRKDELGLLAADFNRLALVLKQNHQDRQQWVSDISHELRTPVAVLQGDIEAAQDGVRKIDEQWLQYMHGHAERLTRLVNDLHQLSQSDSGTLSYRFQTVDLRDPIKQAAQQFEKSCHDCFIDVSLTLPEAPVLVLADDARMNQLLSNLAQNTLRYTDGDAQQHGQLHISVEETSEHFLVRWQDSSPGVSPDELDRLFDRLYRVEASRSRESGGSGLGLAIVKNIVEAHRGTICAQLSEFGGLDIQVTLPKESEQS